jgi:hypothetical protein
VGGNVAWLTCRFNERTIHCGLFKTLGDAVGLLCLSAFTLYGYTIWWRWGEIAFRKIDQSRRFWAVCAAYQFLWLLLGVYWHQDMPGPLTLTIQWYSVVVIAVCAFLAFWAGRATHHIEYLPALGTRT